MSTLQEVSSLQRREYEWRFAAAVAHNADYARSACGWLEAGHIQQEGVRQFWQGIQAGQSVIQAAQEVHPTFYADVSRYIPQVSSFEIRDYANEITRWAYLGEMSRQANSLAMAISSGDTDAVQTVVGGMAQVQNGAHAYSRGMDELAPEFISLVDNIEGRSIKTHLPPLDDSTGGLERQTLTMLAARPGMGKTALAWQIARTVADAGGTSLFISLEMSANNLIARAACGAVGVRWRDVRSGRVSPADRQRVKDAALAMIDRYDGRLVINDKPNTVGTVQREVSILRPDIVFIDHLRWLQDKGDSEIVRLGMMTARLKEMSKEFNCAVVCLHQLNRGVEGRDNKRPQLSDLRESGQVEENTDNALFLYRPDYYDDTPVDPSPTEIIIGKFRDDVANQQVRVDFHKGRQWFTRSGERV